MTNSERQTVSSVTIREVARRAEVSPMTVSRVINGSAQVRGETRERVEQVIAELGYVPNSLARGLARQKTGTLALLVPDVSNPFFTQIAHGAETMARGGGYRVILCNTESDLALEREYIQEMLAYRVDGLLIAPANDLSQRNLRLLEQYHVPFVLLDRAVAGLACDIVQGDNIGGGRRLVEHLIALGHRHIACLGGDLRVSTTRERVIGYQQALEADSITWDAGLVLPSSLDIASGVAAAERMLRCDPLPTAVFAVNNFVAVGVVQALRAHGLRVPEDIALVCFDDIEHAALLCPFLTVMEQPARTFGTIAAQLLVERIVQSTTIQPRYVVLTPTLVVRESCGAQLLTPML